MKQRLAELWLELTADKKKSAALGALGLLLLVVSVRAAIGTRKSPAPRPASLAGLPAARGGAAAPHPAGSVAADAAPKETALSSPDLRELERLRDPNSPLRDLFAFDSRAYPDAPRDAGANRANGANSPTGMADYSGEESATSEEGGSRRAHADVGQLRLRSLALGATPVAVVEVGEGGARKSFVVRAGDSVLGLRVTSVGAEGVRLERDGSAILLPPPERHK